MRKVEPCVFSKTNDNNKTLVDAMQHTDNASFNDSSFESVHHIACKKMTGGEKLAKNVESCHNFSSNDFMNEASVEKDADFRNVDESDVPLLSLFSIIQST